jgi:periplasmic divalent cation tolerance protein
MCPNLDIARKLARQVIEKGIGASVHLIRGIETYYHWNGELCEDQEIILLASLSQKHWEAFQEQVRKSHPYDHPVVFALPINQCPDSFAQWVKERSTGVPYHVTSHKTH